MRIQHNIMAMNSYRNYNNNASALGKNLEKLSSGYKINRAGDDAAGLAISEKMRAQIKGLSAAQKNVKDGISLVKTAEGAMQEIQDMLSRMKYLATQSSNGTYDNDVDRKALQDEVDQLKSEINRIADSANFNGIKLLDGSLSGSGSSSTSKLVAPTVDNFDLTLVPGTKAQTTLKVAKTSIGLGDFNVTVDLNGKQVTYTYKVQATKGGTMEMVDANGKVITASTAGSVKFSGTKVHVSKGFQFKASVFNKDLADRLKKDFGDSYSFSVSAGGTITIKAKTEGVDALKTGSYTTSYLNKSNVSKNAKTALAITAGVDPTWTVTAGKFEVVSDIGELADKTYTVNGMKFAFAKDATIKGLLEAADSSLHIIVHAGDNGKATKAVIGDLAREIRLATGLDVRSSDGTTLKFFGNKGSGGAGGGLQLQIGDTSDAFNQLKVAVGDMHTNGAMKIEGVSIASINSAANAVDTVKDAINYVSGIRGTLGAIQNRLEHTQNNLSVMTENIQDAESTIRDTDVADEMMAYTKNNILIQSAQAMLAQANAVPQGVLQLLQ